jgi:ATP adenylyltransferase
MLCPFCDTEAMRLRLVEERARVFVIFSEPRIMLGHLLAIPKRHVEHLSELGAEESADLFATAVEYQSKIVGRIAAGCDISQHDRPFIRQSQYKIDHVHLHIQPREPFDDLYQASRGYADLFRETTSAERAMILDRLRAS